MSNIFYLFLYIYSDKNSIMKLSTRQQEQLNSIGGNQIPLDQSFSKTTIAIALLNEEKTEWYFQNQKIGDDQHSNVCKAYDYLLDMYQEDVKKYVKNDDEFMKAKIFGEIIINSAAMNPTIGNLSKMDKKDFNRALTLSGTGCVVSPCKNQCDSNSILGINKSRMGIDKHGDVINQRCYCDKNIIGINNSKEFTRKDDYLEKNIKLMLK